MAPRRSTGRRLGPAGCSFRQLWAPRILAETHENDRQSFCKLSADRQTIGAWISGKLPKKLRQAAIVTAAVNLQSSDNRLSGMRSQKLAASYFL
jgi:hypothetical protein